MSKPVLAWGLGIGALMWGCGGGGSRATNDRGGLVSVCCSGELAGSGYRIPICACQPTGTIVLAPGASASLTVSGSTCTETFVNDGGTQTLVGTVVSACNEPSLDGSAGWADDAGLPVNLGIDASATESPLDGTAPETSRPGPEGGVGYEASAPRDAGAEEAGAQEAGAVLGCARWRVCENPGTTASASVVGGVLVLQRPEAASAPTSTHCFNSGDVAVSQAGLTGDFDISIEWRNFQPGSGVSSSGPEVRAGVWWYDPRTGQIDQATGTVGAGLETATVYNAGNGPTNTNTLPTPASLGSFRIQRQGGLVTVTTTVVSQTVTAQSLAPFLDQPLTLFLQIGNQDTIGTGTASIEITVVTVVGGGAQVHSDNFACMAQ